MNPLFIAAFVLALLACVLLIAWIHAMDRADRAEAERVAWKPTRAELRKLRQQKVELGKSITFWR